MILFVHSNKLLVELNNININLVNFNKKVLPSKFKFPRKAYRKPYKLRELTKSYRPLHQEEFLKKSLKRSQSNKRENHLSREVSLCKKKWGAKAIRSRSLI